MLKLIVGTKGSGKTKTMIDMIDKAVKTTSGNIVVIEKCMKLTTEINHSARLVDVDEYGIVGADMLYGFVAGMLAGNYDITELLMAERAISSVLHHNSEPAMPERIPQNVNDLLDDLIEQSVAIVGKPVAMMTKEDKIAAIQFLYQAGAFLVTKSGDKVSKYFGISKYTLYSYIDAKKD